MMSVVTGAMMALYDGCAASLSFSAGHYVSGVRYRQDYVDWMILRSVQRGEIE